MTGLTRTVDSARADLARTTFIAAGYLKAQPAKGRYRPYSPLRIPTITFRASTGWTCRWRPFTPNAARGPTNYNTTQRASVVLSRSVSTIRGACDSKRQRQTPEYLQPNVLFDL
jgi:hypothetical protein